MSIFPLSIHWLMDRSVGSFPCHSGYSSDNCGMRISGIRNGVLCILPRSDLIGPYYGSIFHCLRNIQTDVHNGHTNSQSHQPWMRLPFPTSSPAFVGAFLANSHSDWGKEEAQCDCNLHFPDDAESCSLLK